MPRSRWGPVPQVRTDATACGRLQDTVVYPTEADMARREPYTQQVTGDTLRMLVG
jgi:hypothetical protein